MRMIYDAKTDPQFQDGYIDINEKRVRKMENGTEMPYRYMHGGFTGTAVRFSLCFPEKEAYEGRFYQYLSPFLLHYSWRLLCGVQYGLWRCVYQYRR